MSVNQVTMIRLEELIPATHNYRKFKEVFNFRKIDYRLKDMESNKGSKGYGMDRLFKCLLYQFMEDLSDRELMLYIQGNNVVECSSFRHQNSINGPQVFSSRAASTTRLISGATARS